MPEDRLTTLYREYGRVIYVRCRAILDDDASAEDATQETFMRVFRYLDSVPDERAALYWIYRVATNVCLNQARTRRRRPLHLATAAMLGQIADRGWEERLVDRGTVRQLVAAVPPRVGSVAWLYHIDGFEQGEVARIIGLSRRAVADRLARFSKEARKLLAKGEA